MKNTYKETPTQTDRILWHLKAGHKLTPIDALNKFGCFRLGARIWDIKEMGFKIRTKLVKTNTNKNIAEYELIKGYHQTKLNL